MMKNLTILAIMVVMAVGATQLQDVSAFKAVDHRGSGGIQISDSVGGFGTFNTYTNLDSQSTFYGVSADRFSNLDRFTEYSLFLTLGDVEFSDDVDISFDSGFYTVTRGSDTVILTEAEYKSLSYVRQGMDYNGAPSQTGMSTIDVDRISWNECVEGTPLIVMSASHVRVAEGKAVCGEIQMYFDGIPLPDVHNIGELREGEKWRSFGGEWFEIPFSAYHMLDDNDTLYSVGPGIEAGTIQVLNTDGEVEDIVFSEAAVRLYKEIYFPEPEYEQPTRVIFWN